MKFLAGRSRFRLRAVTMQSLRRLALGSTVIRR